MILIFMNNVVVLLPKAISSGLMSYFIALFVYTIHKYSKTPRFI